MKTITRIRINVYTFFSKGIFLLNDWVDLTFTVRIYDCYSKAD